MNRNDEAPAIGYTVEEIHPTPIFALYKITPQGRYRVSTHTSYAQACIESYEHGKEPYTYGELLHLLRYGK